MEVLVLGVRDSCYLPLALWYWSSGYDRTPGQHVTCHVKSIGYLVMFRGTTLQYKFYFLQEKEMKNDNKNKQNSHTTWVKFLVVLPPAETPLGKFPEHKLI